MNKIKLFDENLGNQKGLSKYISPELEWIRDDENHDYDIAIYTDKLCFVESIYNENKKNYAWIIEPPIINGENYLYIKEKYKKFNKVFSYKRSLKDEIPNFQFIPHGGTWLREDDISIHKKEKNISFIYSDKTWNSGHKLRHKIADLIIRKNELNIDFFGSGSKNPIEFKITGLEKYKFSITIENSQEDDYFTEKIIDCFLTGTVPIYYGTKNIGNYFNVDGIITFNDEDEFFEKINKINDQTYENMLTYVKENFEKAKEYIHPENYINRIIENE